MRKFVGETVKETVESMKLEDFLGKVLDDSFKRSLMKKGGKIYPIRAFEIMKIEKLN
jgi:ribosomal protein S3AE